MREFFCDGTKGNKYGWIDIIKNRKKDLTIFIDNELDYKNNVRESNNRTAHSLKTDRSFVKINNKWIVKTI